VSVIVDKDCVTLPDGKLLCYDPDDGYCYILTKKKAEARELTRDRMMKLVAHISNQRKAW
jgi:hypothetical protein